MNNSITNQSVIQAREEGLKPLPLLQASVIFLGLGICFRFFIYSGIPILLNLGVHPFAAFLITFNIPLGTLFLLAFIFVKQEGNPMTLASLAERFRLRPFGWRPIFLMLAVYVVSIILSLLLSPTRGWIIELSAWLGPNETFPRLLNPTLQNQDIIRSAAAWMGPEAVGNWGWAAMTTSLLFLNIFGEELFWRGVLLPRQELVHGKQTWLIHGLLWLLFHLPFYPWYLVFGLPSTLGIAFLAQKTKNTWPPLILHTLFNGAIYSIMILIIFGVIP